MRIAVIGAGTMGHGIAQAAAMAGHEVALHDVRREALESALQRITWSLQKLKERGRLKEEPAAVLARIRPTGDLAEAAQGAHVAIEAVPEDLALKREVFRGLSELAPPDALLATNTSSLPITEIAEAVPPERRGLVVGMHFFNPPVLMPLVEVVRGRETSDGAVERAAEFARGLGKEPVTVNRDVPGFVVNRILLAVSTVACWMVYRGDHTPVEIDAAVKYKAGLPMGLFELRDFNGIDVGYMVTRAIAQRDPMFTECPLLEEMYRKGALGVKAGRGFYDYSGGRRPEIPREAGERVDVVRVLAPAVNMAAWLLRNGVAERDQIDLAVRLGLNWPKGPLKMADEWGITKVVQELRGLYERYRLPLVKPDELLLTMLREGKLGMKFEKGFYDY